MRLLLGFLVISVSSASFLDRLSLLFGARREPHDKWENTYPTVVFHGVHDDCSNSLYQDFVDAVNSNVTGSYSECIEIEKGHEAFTSVFTSIESQGEKYCKAIKNHKVFGQASHLNLVGFSQGGIIARYIIEMCDLEGIELHRYLSIGGPQMGVTETTNCEGKFTCEIINYIGRNLAYLGVLQKHIAPAGYFRDTHSKSKYEKYLKDSSFLPYLNNEVNHTKAAEYKKKMMDLDRIMLVQFGSDDVVVPHESENFQDYKGDDAVPVNASRVYTEDWIGVEDLQVEGHLEHVLVPNATHLQYPSTMPVETFIPFLFGEREDAETDQALKFIEIE